MKHIKLFEGWKYEIAEVSKGVIKDWKDKIEYILLPMMDELEVLNFSYDRDFEISMNFQIEDLDFVREEITKTFNYLEKLELETEVRITLVHSKDHSAFLKTMKTLYRVDDVEEVFSLLKNTCEKHSKGNTYFSMLILVSDPLDGEDVVTFNHA